MRFSVIILCLIFFSFLVKAREIDNFVYDARTKSCLNTKNKQERRSPQLAKNFQYAQADFFLQNPICAAAPTCISPERLQLLIRNHAIPRGIESKNFLSSEFSKKAQQVCQTQYSSDTKMFDDLILKMQGKAKDYPIETKMSYELVQTAKKNVDQYLEHSGKALTIIKNCLKLSAKYDSSSSRSKNADQGKIELYQQELAKNPNLQKGCERIWQPESELSFLQSQLTRIRQALYGLNLVENRKEEIRHIQGQIFGVIKANSFWDSAPKKHEGISEQEKNTFPDYISDLAKKHGINKQDKESLRKALVHDYFNVISENPILIYFSKAQPKANDFLSAFEKYDNEFKKSGKAKIDDMDYLSIPVGLESALFDLPENLRGDYCILAEYMTRSRREHFEVPEKLLTGLMLIEGGLVASAAKGIFKKTFGFLFGAKYAGTTLSAHLLEKSYRNYQQQLQLCKNVAQQGQGLCRVSKLEVEGMSSSVSGAMLLMFGSRTHTKTALPIIISGDKEQTQ